MKKLLALFMLCFSFTSTFAAPKFNHIVIFGDSLTDPGYLYNILFKVLPKSPPYYEGRFSNGPTWAEELGKYYYSKHYIENDIYALGGATAVFHMPSTKFISTSTLQWEVDKYILNTLFHDRSTTLFIIWIGGNDYLYDAQANADASTTEISDRIAWSISKLSSYGGKHFLVLNLPDLSKTPIAKENGESAQLYALSILHNQKLAAALENEQKKHPDISLLTFNIYTMLNDVIKDPTKYNEKYGVHITDTTNACWGGGYVLRKHLNKTLMANEIERSMIANYGKVPKGVSPAAAADYISRSPELAYVYALGQSYKEGNLPCTNPSEHIFWDSIHPTAVVHQVLAVMLEETLENA